MKTMSRKYIFYFLFVFLLLTGIITGFKNPAQGDFLSLYYARYITMDSLKYMVEVLASDSLEGRETGTEGEFKAAYFLANLHLENGVLPGVENYMQEYEVISAGMPNVTISTDRKTFVAGEDFLSLFPHDSTYIYDDHIIYVGFGIHEPSWNDYAYRDVRGKIVLAKEGEPVDGFGNPILTATERRSEWSADPIHAYILKRNAALKHGAKAFLYYASDNFEIFKQIFNRIHNRMSKITSIKSDTLYDFIINEKVLEELTGYNSLDSVYYTGRRDRKWPVPITISYKSKLVSYFSQNIIAKVEGNEKADEIILVIANHDHLGKENDSIYYPGANNNATGSAALIELAKAFQQAAEDGYIMKRSIYFVHFSGREKNHRGANYFFKHMPFSKNKIKYVIDLDKLGFLDTLSSDPTVVYLAINQKNKSFLKKLREVNNAGPKMKVEIIDHFALYASPLQASDGIIFYSRKYPVYTFNNGLFYPFDRTPQDTPDMITWDVFLQRTRYVFLTVWLLSNE